jgi:hypothetical protein
MDDGSTRPPLADRLKDLAGTVSSVVAPITLISAVLFYFGYVYTTTEYAYFGLDVDTIGLSTQEFIMRSPGPLLTPLLTVGLVTAAVALAHGALRRRIDAAAAEAPWRLRRFRRLALACAIVGRTALAAGMVMVLAYPYVRPFLALYDLITPAVLASGAGLTAYGLRLDGLLGRPPRRAANVALYAVLTTGLLWATATLAQYIGQGQAVMLAAQLGTARPAVILDTKERLYLTTRVIDERMLPSDEDQAFRYRYRGLRLLIQGKDRLFLVPGQWSPGDATLVVPMNDGVRVQFQSS